MAELYGFQSEAFRLVQEAVNKYRAELMEKRGVRGVRAGYRVVNRWVTTTPVIVVHVDRKKIPSELSPDEMIPTQYEGILTDVAQASAQEIRAFERKRPHSDADVADITRAILEDVTVDEFAISDSTAFDGATIKKYTKLRETPPEHFPNDASKEDLVVLCHAGPDAGWLILSEYLRATKKGLRVAIYDFKADYIKRRLVDSLKALNPRRLDLIIDPKLEAVEKDVLVEIENELKPDFKVVLASVHSTKGVFASAFHPKVAIRDNEALWLSSGNWSPSSQPDVDPFSTMPIPFDLLKRKNREYHVVVSHAGLAQEVSAYIEHDADLSEKNPIVKSKDGDDGPILPEEIDPENLYDLLIPRDAFEAFMGSDQPLPPAAQLRFFMPQEVRLKYSDGDSAQPLFTQENYIEEITRLLTGATKKLYLQFQYIRHRAESPAEFKNLIKILKQKIDQKIDVRVIVGANSVRRDLENLVGIELDISRFKVQVGCHNKALLVDNEFVVVGSQNWSGDGTTRNEDTSILFRSRDAYQYYEQIFLHDWEGLAAQDIREPLIPIPIATDQPTPSGMVRFAWREFFDE